MLKSDGYVIPAEGGTVRAKEGQALNFTMLHPDDELHTGLAQTIQTSWEQIGVQVNLQPVPYDRMVFDHLGPRTYQAALVDLNLARTPDPDPYPFRQEIPAVAEGFQGKKGKSGSGRFSKKYAPDQGTESGGKISFRARHRRHDGSRGVENL